MTSPQALIVIGASMGGVTALQRLTRALRADLDAAVCVVQHTHPSGPPRLHEVVGIHSDWVTVTPEQATPLARGHLYVAPPDWHMVIDGDHVRRVRGPRENHTRPAIDPLFRTAATAWRERAIGVVLTGMLDDGTAGLQAIARCGGRTVVQDPDDADWPSMPTSAIRFARPEHIVALDAMPELLARLVAEMRLQRTPPTVPTALALEARIDREGCSTAEREEALGEPAPLGCPACGGPLWKLDDHPERYRCHTGHAFTQHALLDAQHREAERAIWVAIRVLEERRRVLRRLVDDGLHEAMGRRLSEVEDQIRVLRALAAGELARRTDEAS